MPNFVIPFKSSTEDIVTRKFLPNSQNTIMLTEILSDDKTKVNASDPTKVLGLEKAKEADIKCQVEASEPTESASQPKDNVAPKKVTKVKSKIEQPKKRKPSKAKVDGSVKIISDGKDKPAVEKSKSRSKKKSAQATGTVLNPKIKQSKNIINKTIQSPAPNAGGTKNNINKKASQVEKKALNLKTKMTVKINSKSAKMKESNEEKDNVLIHNSFDENILSQQSTYTGAFLKLTLSQPSRKLSHKDRLQWLQERRKVGIWVECCRPDCKKWRYLANVYDPLEIPEIWYCEMNPDVTANDCNVKEWVLRVVEEEDLIHSMYSAGSVVWAHLQGYPRWPGIIDDCPDTEQFYWLNGFSDIPIYYNVTFFDEINVSRAWIMRDKLRPYVRAGNRVPIKIPRAPKEFRHRLAVAVEQADDAMTLGVAERLKKYSFVTRYPGPINKPVSGKKRKRQLSTDTNTDDSSSDGENDTEGESEFQIQDAQVSTQFEVETINDREDTSTEAVSQSHADRAERASIDNDSVVPSTLNLRTDMSPYSMNSSDFEMWSVKGTP